MAEEDSVRSPWLTALTVISLASLTVSSGCDSRSMRGPGPGPGGADSGSPSTPLCADTCPFAFDGECDDGGPASITSVCEYGTDCGDCGPRVGGCVPSCFDRECGPDGCGGTCGTCPSGECNDGVCTTGGGGSCDPSEPPRCEGNVAVSCELVGGVGARVRETCRDGCEDGRCVTTRPTSVRITGQFGSVEPIFTGEPPDIAGFLGLSVSSPSYSPSVPALPNLASATSYTVRSPSPGGCDVSAAFVLSSSSLGIQMTGRGVDCIYFFESAADGGVQIDLPGVPYNDGIGTVDVTIDVTP